MRHILLVLVLVVAGCEFNPSGQVYEPVDGSISDGGAVVVADAGASEDALVVDAAECPGGCDDGFVWTADTCNNDECSSQPTNCGGMVVRVPLDFSIDTVCRFWGGWGLPEGTPAPQIDTFVEVDSPDWMNAPDGACSVQCANNATGRVVRLDLWIEWNGTGFEHQILGGLLLGTWDGQNFQN